MATVEQCEQALRSISDKLASASPEEKRKADLNRSLSCTVTDLDTTFSGRLSGDGITDLRRDDPGEAQIRLTTTSDDLIALTEGRLSFLSAWSSGRLKVSANPLDLIKMRGLF